MARINRWLDAIGGDFDAGDWIRPQQQSDGATAMGYVDLSEQARAFVQELYGRQVIVGFDWPGWMETEGRRLHEQPELLSDATLEDCRRLLIAIVRGDRFKEGLLLQAFRDGIIERILTRRTELAGR